VYLQTNHNHRHHLSSIYDQTVLTVVTNNPCLFVNNLIFDLTVDFNPCPCSNTMMCGVWTPPGNAADSHSECSYFYPHSVFECFVGSSFNSCLMCFSVSRVCLNVLHLQLSSLFCSTLRRVVDPGAMIRSRAGCLGGDTGNTALGSTSSIK